MAIGTLYPDELAPLARPAYSPYAGQNYPTRVLWGDTHLHTANSLDAAAFGDTLGPEEAYRFARGEEVVSSTGQPVKLSRPLDFLVVADHAEGLGGMLEVKKGNPAMMADSTLKRWHDMIAAGGQSAIDATIELVRSAGTKTTPALLFDPRVVTSVWQDYTATAERYNEPGKFTALIGYEWTSNNSGNNLHRVVIFRDGKDKADMIVPFSALDSEDPAMLWKFLDAYQAKTGGEALAIPHNGNLSNGRMFGLVDFEGHDLTRAYAETRARLEPVYEVTQIKGDGETHQFLSPNDEFAGYEVWDKGNLDLTALKKPEMLQYEYARSALKLGLKLEKQLGINPFKFGMIGSTDSHTSLATADEDNFFGKHSGVEPSPTRGTSSVCAVVGRQDQDHGLGNGRLRLCGGLGDGEHPGGDLRCADAQGSLRHHGSAHDRAILRRIGFQPADAQTRDTAAVGYSKGVPMGGDLSNAPQGKVAELPGRCDEGPDRRQPRPHPDRQGLGGCQWRLQEKVYDVVWGDPQSRKPGTNGKLPPVGSTVNMPDASYTNSIGAPELVTVWTDPDFDPALRAFYYARVIEIPTPRWTAYDAKRFGVEMPKEVPMTTQERAYTSPIWYTPKS